MADQPGWLVEIHSVQPARPETKDKQVRKSRSVPVRRPADLPPWLKTTKDLSLKQRSKKAFGLADESAGQLGTSSRKSSKPTPGGKSGKDEVVPENPKSKWYPKMPPETDVAFLARKKREQAANEVKWQKQVAERQEIEHERALKLREERVKQEADANKKRALKLAQKQLKEKEAMAKAKARANAKDAVTKIKLVQDKKPENVAAKVGKKLLGKVRSRNELKLHFRAQAAKMQAGQALKPEDALVPKKTAAEEALAKELASKNKGTLQSLALLASKTELAKTADGQALLDKNKYELKLQIAAEIKKKEAALDPKRIWPTFVSLRRELEECQRHHFEDLQEYKNAMATLKEINLSIDEWKGEEEFKLRKMPRTAGTEIELFQDLFDKTYIKFGLDGEPPPPKLKVQKVLEIFHERTQAEYYLRRKLLVQECDEGGLGKFGRIPVNSQKLAWKETLGLAEEPDPNYNEFYLFHGTSQKVANAIADTDFYISQGEPAHGDTFGKGIYMAEWSSHAWFFADSKEDLDGGNPNDGVTILVCRVFCGRINDVGKQPNTGDRHEKAGEYEAALRNHTFHCTMGREWPENWNIREFILADDDQVLPEFIVYCKPEPC